MRLGCGEELQVSVRRIPVEGARKMSYPGALDRIARENFYKDVRLGMRYVPKRIRTDESVDVRERGARSG